MNESSTGLCVGLPTSSFLPTLGGLEVGLHNIAARLVSRGHRPVVIAPAPHCKALRAGGYALPYPVAAFPPKVWGVLRHAPQLGLHLFDSIYAHLQRRHRFAVWHGTMGYPIGVTLAHFAVPRHIAHVVRCAGEDIQIDSSIGYGLRQNPAIDRLVRRELPRADRLVAITESVADEYRRLNVPPAQIARIPNGVDLQRFAGTIDRDAIRAQFGIGPDTTLFLCVGRNHPKKNLAALIRAAAQLRTRLQSKFALLIVGDGTQSLASLAAEFGIGDMVHLHTASATADADIDLELPPQSLVDLYRSADVFVFPSLIETFGIAIVEAMAAGLPVITTDAPGCRDLIRDGEDGLMVPAGDIAALTEAMQRVCAEPALRRDLAIRAHRRAQDFSWDAVVDSYIALYRDVIAARRAGDGNTDDTDR